MSNEWLQRSLSSLEDETRNWPDWKREAASREPHLAIPGPEIQVRSGEASAPSSIVAASEER